MSKKVITPVGTSLFDNYQERGNRLPNEYATLKKNDKADYKTPLADRWAEYEQHRKIIKSRVLPWAKNHLEQSASAEITSILNILDEEKEDLSVYLLASETLVSRLAAEILTESLNGCTNKAGHSVAIHFDPALDVIAGLQVRNQDSFRRDGLKHLISRIHTITAGNFQDVLLNVTGGYKAVIPYLSILGQIEKIPLRYIFEDSTALIKIPRLPINFDFSFIEDYYIAFEWFHKDPKNWPSPEEFKVDLDADSVKAEQAYQRLSEEYQLLEEVEKDGKQQVHLTALGRMLVAKYEQLIEDDEDGCLERMKIIGKLAELKVFQHYVTELGPSANVIPGKIVGASDFDIDVYIEEGEERCTAIEVKTGANPPILNRPSNKKKKKKENTIERNVTEGGFHSLLEQHSQEKLNLMVILYHHKAIHPKSMEQIQQLHDMYPDKTRNLGWYQLCLPPNYKINVKWEVQNNLKHLYGKKLTIGGKEYV